MQSARQEILNKLKQAVHKIPEKPDFESPVYHTIKEPLDLVFKENLEKVNGSVHLFNSESELYSKLKKYLLNFTPKNIFCKEKEIQDHLNRVEIAFSKNPELPDSLEVGITGCEFLIAHTGSALVSSAQQGGRQLFVYPPVHIIIAKKDQIVKYLENAYDKILKKYPHSLPSQLTLITGPSRTADIEKTLILGAHGPKELHVFIA